MLIFLILLIAIIASAVSVIRIAIYGGSLWKPDFHKALTRINEGNMFGEIFMERKWFVIVNAVSYYLILFGWLALIVGTIYWIVK